MNTEKIIDLINSSDLNKIQKNVTIGFINRAEQAQTKRSLDRELIIETSRENKLYEIILSTDEVKIYTVSGDIKYPYRSIYLDKDGIWRRINTVSPSLDTAYLVYLENKHLGENSRFTDFAIKMLEIKIGE